MLYLVEAVEVQHLAELEMGLAEVMEVVDLTVVTVPKLARCYRTRFSFKVCQKVPQRNCLLSILDLLAPLRWTSRQANQGYGCVVIRLLDVHVVMVSLVMSRYRQLVWLLNVSIGLSSLVQ
jgi:hypothetical protein